MFADVRRELEVPASFPPEVLAEAAAAAAASPRPDATDATDLPLVTIDPPGSMDLDQAMHVERLGPGYRVYYAIADVAAFVSPGRRVDAEAHVRGVTLYSPDQRTPLHPPVLGEGAASLLPDRDRPAVLWTIDLDADGERRSAVDVRRDRRPSRARLDYAEVQRRSTRAARAPEPLRAAARGRPAARRQLRAATAARISLPVPEQEVDAAAGGGYRLNVPRAAARRGLERADLPAHRHGRRRDHARSAGIGVLRTLPPPDEGAVAIAAAQRGRPRRRRGRRRCRYQDFCARAVDPACRRTRRCSNTATSLLRGAGYTAFDGARARAGRCTVRSPPRTRTRPRRCAGSSTGTSARSASRSCAGREVPAWVRTALPLLPAVMATADRRAHALERAMRRRWSRRWCWRRRSGETFAAVVVGRRPARSGTVQLADPAVRARCDGRRLPLGERIDVRLVEADPVTRARPLFEPRLRPLRLTGTADESAGRPRCASFGCVAEEGPGSTGQGGG